MSLLQKFRQWFDGWEYQPKDQAIAVQFKAQEFAVCLARDLDARLRQEILTLPDGPALVPVAWLIFLSSYDDRAWRGLKRQALQQWLSRILLERVTAILPSTGATQNLLLDIRLDPTLPAGEFKILPLWDLPTSPGVLGLPNPGRQL